MINDPTTALKFILQSNSSITALLGKYSDGVTPLIAFGRLAEVEMNKNALVYYLNSDSPHNTLNNTVYTINCYSQDTDVNHIDADRNSVLLAQAVVKQTNEKFGVAGVYAVTMSSRILTTIQDPAIKEANTAVEIQLFNIGGA